MVLLKLYMTNPFVDIESLVDEFEPDTQLVDAPVRTYRLKMTLTENSS